MFASDPANPPTLDGQVIELPIKHPELFDALGVAQPKGVILYGPPGTGKTLLARAVAHHTDCTFIRVSGSELVQKYIGEGSRMVRELFVMAREHAPSIIFMDEASSGPSRQGALDRHCLLSFPRPLLLLPVLLKRLLLVLPGGLHRLGAYGELWRGRRLGGSADHARAAQPAGRF